MVSYFHIGKYIFHHFGYHETGALALQLAVQSKITLPLWKTTYEYNNTERESLIDFLLTHYEPHPAKKDGGKVILKEAIVYRDNDLPDKKVGDLYIYESASVTWNEQIEYFCSKYGISVHLCNGLKNQFLSILNKTQFG